jgi:hypothetical protein
MDKIGKQIGQSKLAWLVADCVLVVCTWTSSDGWMRELKLKLDADQSHHLLDDARNIWSYFRKTAQSKLKKQQEQELQKRTAEGQPGGAPAAKREKHTR